LEVIARAVLTGMLVMLAGTIPRNLLFAANLRYHADVPWAVPVTAAYLWCFWRYLGGAGPPASTAEQRRGSLRARRVPGRVWAWALLAGGLGIVALVLALRVANRFVVLPEQRLPDFAGASRFTVVSLLLAAAPVAGIVEEAAFRGYMQGPIERRYGLAVAILVTGTMFAVAHLDFTPVLWPYYVAVAALYGVVTCLTKSILPAMVLHTGGNVYSNLGLWLLGRAEWQAASRHGAEASLWKSGIAFTVVTVAMLWAFLMLSRSSEYRGRTPCA
jgi:membrane protease YdiL (CAAX protease family)